MSFRKRFPNLYKKMQTRNIGKTNKKKNREKKNKPSPDNCIICQLLSPSHSEAIAVAKVELSALLQCEQRNLIKTAGYG